MKTLNELFRMVILANELDNNLKFALRFSDPDGVRSGKSGWSFGICQFDTQNNDQAIACLKDCGFTDEEITGIVKQSINVAPFAKRLADHADVVAEYDNRQLSKCLNQALNWNTINGVLLADTASILAAADYDNQYGSQGESFLSWIKELDHSVTAEDVLKFKLECTKYGKTHPEDCRRRYDNLMRIMRDNL